jgi:dsDNA-specific endonuclease/ATPase MutS2
MRRRIPRDETSHEEEKGNRSIDEPFPASRTPLAEDGSPFAAPVTVPIEDALDLHAFVPREIPSVVAEYLDAAARAGFREVRLIHGRGRGVQRRCVHAALAGHALVERFADAPPERGGWGATISWLRKAR